jgi:hypothetical protein
MLPAGISFSPTTASDDFHSNSYTLTEWKVLEKNGAVFLPCAGVRIGKNVTFGDSETEGNHYWTSTNYSFWDGFQNDYQNARTLCISIYHQEVLYQKKYYGCAVRLVRDVE